MCEANEFVRKRALSLTRAEDIQILEKRTRKSQPDKPIHRPRDSLFSWNSGFDNFTGFVNWAFLLLTIGGFRLLLENFIKYGIRVDPLQWIYMLVDPWSNSEHPTIVLLVYSVVPVTLCLLTEKGLSVEIIGNGYGLAIHVINLIALIVLPMVIIHTKDTFTLVGASAVCTIYSILFLKLWSFVQVNHWCRMVRYEYKVTMRRQSLSCNKLKQSTENINANKFNSSEDIKDSDNMLVQYPDNLSLGDLYYFLCAPTLCYELNFPKTDRIRKRFLMKRIFEVLAGSQLILAIIQQYMIPAVKNSIIPFGNMDFANATERLLKLAIPNHLAWLCFFYILFHSWLNLLGELLHFADRNFYNDWWNANNIDLFWRNWNLPVHQWAVRHLYIPLVNTGYSKMTASVIVFFISAFFHEYMVSVPLKTYKIWAFMGMMGQIPLSYLSRYMENHYGPRLGNIVVWASIIIGQPLCIMMYYHDYLVLHHAESLHEFSPS